MANLLGSSSEASEVPPPDKRVVIFIDDLDRCAASAMFSLLESIKIYLNLRHCVFVLGINRHEVERGITSVLPEAPSEDQRQVRAHEYIEKLCGNMVRLPFPGKAAQRLMLRAWLKLETLHHDNEFLGKVTDQAVQHWVLPQNPRRIKMWCNTVLLMYEHRVKQLGPPLPNGTYQPPSEDEAAALVLMACLYAFYPVLHQAMAACEDVSFLLTLKTWCQAEKDFDLAIFDCTKRVFAKPALIRQINHNGNLSTNSEILRRAYLQAPSQNDERDPEPPQEKPLPLLIDPSSLSFFHPQRLVADESITEAQIKPYLHLD